MSLLPVMRRPAEFFTTITDASCIILILSVEVLNYNLIKIYASFCATVAVAPLPLISKDCADSIFILS